MENYDADFSTLKRGVKSKPLSAWKADIPICDGDATLKLKQAPTAERGGLQIDNFSDSCNRGLDDDFGDDFDEDFVDGQNFVYAFQQGSQKVSKSLKSVPILPPHGTSHQKGHGRTTSELSISDAFSDLSAKSLGRASVSSLASSASVATSWDNDDDFEEDFDDFAEEEIGKPNLKQRFAEREERARREAESEAQHMAESYERTLRKRASKPFVDFDDAALDFDGDQLSLRVKNGVANRNIKLATRNPPSRMLKGMRSIAQFPQQRLETSSKLRGAVSMMDLGRKPTTFEGPTSFERPTSFEKPSSFERPNHSERRNYRTNAFGAVTSPNERLASVSESPLGGRVRPLTAYKEKLDATRKRKKPTVIRNPISTLTCQERAGMVFNPQSLTWEGNDADASRFDMVVDLPKPRLITEIELEMETPPMPNSMLFDNRTLSWVYANEEEYDDPFAAIDEEMLPSPANSIPPSLTGSMTESTPSPAMSTRDSPRPASRIITNESQASTVSSMGRHSVARSETSAHEVFDVTPRMAAEWRHADERFMRKFGKWIGGEEERTDALNADQHFYEMVRHA